MQPKKTGRPIDGEFKKVGSGRWAKWNPILRIRTVLEVSEYDGRGQPLAFRVYRQQPREDIEAILDLNVQTQNSWKGRYGADLGTQTTRIPIVIEQQIKEKCGFIPGQGYDEKKFRQIVNDRDYYKLKTVTGRI